VSNAGGMGTEIYENKIWTNIKMPFKKQKVICMSAGYDFSYIVTEGGLLYCTGNNMLTKLNIPNLNKFERIDLG
jgi:alpha-tubulin suppressor-like RCC1 family protein